MPPIGATAGRSRTSTPCVQGSRCPAGRRGDTPVVAVPPERASLVRLRHRQPQGQISRPVVVKPLPLRKLDVPRELVQGEVEVSVCSRERERSVRVPFPGKRWPIPGVHSRRAEPDNRRMEPEAGKWAEILCCCLYRLPLAVMFPARSLIAWFHMSSRLSSSPFVVRTLHR